jgi:hypothetical protein
MFAAYLRFPTGALSNLIKIVNVLKNNPSLVLTETEESDASQEEGQVVVGNLLAYRIVLVLLHSIIDT